MLANAGRNLVVAALRDVNVFVDDEVEIRHIECSECSRTMEIQVDITLEVRGFGLRRGSVRINTVELMRAAGRRVRADNGILDVIRTVMGHCVQDAIGWMCDENVKRNFHERTLAIRDAIADHVQAGDMYRLAQQERDARLEANRRIRTNRNYRDIWPDRPPRWRHSVDRECYLPEKRPPPQPRDEVESRGLRILLENLTPVQSLDYRNLGYFYVTGGDTGRGYVIAHGTHVNIYVLKKGSDTVCEGKLCFVPAGGLCYGDVMLSQKFGLECNEASVLKVANKF